MPFQSILDELLNGLPGGRAALLLDVEGEVAVAAGARDYQHRLIGAYQGITLAAARRTHQRSETGRVRNIVCRYRGGILILRPLNDGYYLILSMGPAGDVTRGLARSASAAERLNAVI